MQGRYADHASSIAKNKVIADVRGNDAYGTQIRHKAIARRGAHPCF